MTADCKYDKQTFFYRNCLIICSSCSCLVFWGVGGGVLRGFFGFCFATLIVNGTSYVVILILN